MVRATGQSSELGSPAENKMNSNSPPKSARILVVDDDAAIRMVIADRFKALGYQTAIARDGDEALQKIEEFEPALVLLDLRMPGKDGFAVLEELKAREVRPAVVVITAHGSIEAAVQAMRMGAQDFHSQALRALSPRAHRRENARDRAAAQSRGAVGNGADEPTHAGRWLE